MTGKANDRQVGGTHYRTGTGLQHWDLVAIFQWDYFTSQVTKYLMRWRQKNGIEDLKKSRHYLDKYIEIAEMNERGDLTKEILMAALRDLGAEEDEKRAVVESILKNGSSADSPIRFFEGAKEPDANCVSTPDGGCIGNDCMHDASASESEAPQLYTVREYPCGCTASGHGDIPSYCAKHGKPPLPLPAKEAFTPARDGFKRADARPVGQPFHNGLENCLCDLREGQIDDQCPIHGMVDVETELKAALASPEPGRSFVDPSGKPYRS